MKKIILTTISAISLLGLNSCNEEDFLAKSPSEFVAVPPTEAKVNGLYLMMINPGTGGTTLNEDFGQKGVDIFTDILSADMAYTSDRFGRYSSFARLQATVDFTNTSNYIPWRYYYRVINAANDAISDLGGNEAVPEDSNQRHLLGQAKGIRAYAYFYLMQLFNTEYNANAEAIPLYLEPTQSGKAKSTQAEVYDAIINDLQSSISLLNDFERANKAMIDANVAKGLLAYTYAQMDRYQESADIAKDIIDNSGYPITSREQVVRADHGSGNASGGGFNDLATPSWMWGFDITLENEINLTSWYGQMDVFSYGYQWAGAVKGIDDALFNSIRTDDIRKQQFLTGGSYKYAPTNKFFDPNREVGGQRSVVTDYIFMRVDEFHLLAAEMYAKAGNESEAKRILKAYLENRLDDTSYIDTLTGTALQDEIYQNTRIEFWGEGKTYLAVKRNKKPVTRSTNHIFRAGETFQYNSDELTFDIPQQEVLNNPNISR